MNKKFLSAILFGAMLATSAGTFVSCKDYDDDIKGLQTQIDTNKTAIAELQKLVGAGNWVTSVAASGENLVVTMSNGTSATIAGIKGADGKDGKDAAEWTISEDGFWCKDGEKTENVAVAKDGKNGVTAPSPTIGANGNWVVYSWNAEKGEFVAEETEIPAAGTSAYAVKADGVYTLYIADENGEYQEIVLPATCDSFVVSSPATGAVEVNVDYATWNTKTSATNKDDFAKIVAAFPEIADLKKGDKLTQDGELPLIVSPAEVELDGSYEFALVGMNGKVADIEVANPTEGISADWKYDNKGVMTRSAENEAGLWTLSVAPVYDTKKKEHASVENAALVVTNAKGVSSRTAFAYTVKNNEVTSNVIVKNANADYVEYAEEIDVLAPIHGDNEDQAVFTFENEYHGKFVLEATSKVQIEEYDITIEGSKLMIGNMPENKSKIVVDLRIVALGLNGSTDWAPKKLEVVQAVAAEELPAKEVTLGAKKQTVRWDVEKDLGMSAVAFNKFMAAEPEFVVSREAYDEEGDKHTYVAYADGIKFFNAKGKETVYEDADGDYKSENWSNGEAVTFGFDVDATKAATETTEMWMPETYTVTLTAKDGNVVVYSAETELVVSNPEIDETYVKLVPAFVKDGVYQITGYVAGNKVAYSIKNALITKNAAAVSFIDLDYAEYSGNDEEDYGFYNWIPFNAKSEADLEENDYANANAIVEVNVWSYEPEELTESPWIKALNNQLYETRRVRAMIALFGNVDNVVPFDFEIVVKSELYSEDASSVTVDATKLTAKFTDDDTSDKVYPNQIDLSKAFTAVVVAGDETGKAYKLFATNGKTTTTQGAAAVYDYSDWSVSGGYVMGESAAKTVTGKTYTTLADLVNKINEGQITVNSEIAAGTKSYTLTNEDLQVIWDKVKVWKNNDLTNKYMMKDGEIVKVKHLAFELDENGEVVFLKNDKDARYWVETPVLEGNKAIYQGNVSLSGVAKDEQNTKILHSLSIIPEDEQEYIDLFNAIKEGIKFTLVTPAGQGSSSTAVVARDGRIASVEFVFDDAEEADKYFTNAINKLNGVVFANTQAESTILKVDEAAQVDVVGGKVVVGMKLKITDIWGMEMVVPFNVEISTK